MKIKNSIGVFLMMGSAWAVTAHASDSHYVPGLEGVKGSVLPPPGLYYKGYAMHYGADKNDAMPPNSKLTVEAIAHRVAWVTTQKVLGADLAFETVWPMMSTDIKVAGDRLDKQTGVGDLYVGGILGWHGDQGDVTLGGGYWADIGKYDKNEPASPGKGHESYMLSLGGNAKLTPTGDVTFSALGRYQMNGSGYDDEILIEWGLGKSYGLWTAGLIGYNTFELSGGNEKRNALGASLAYFSPTYMLGGDIAAYQEFSNKEAFEGTVLRAALIKRF